MVVVSGFYAEVEQPQRKTRIWNYCDGEDMRDWLDSPNQAPVWGVIQPGERSICKYLAPETVTDLVAHYQATRQLYGSPSVSCLVIYMIIITKLKNCLVIETLFGS